MARRPFVLFGRFPGAGLAWPILFLSRLGSIALVFYVAWLAWDNLGPRKPQVGPLRRELADRIIPSVVEDLRQARSGIHGAALLHFENDPSDYFTNSLRSTIEQNGTFDLADSTALEKLYNVLRLRQRSYGGLDAARSRGKSLGTEGVICGVIHSFESFKGGAKLDVEVNLVDAKSGQVVFSRRYDKDNSQLDMLPATVAQAAGARPWFQRFLAWLMAVLLLPVFTISFIRAMVKKESNRANAFVLAVYTIVDVALAYLLVGGVLTTWFAVAVFILAIAAAFGYNVKVMGFAVRLET